MPATIWIRRGSQVPYLYIFSFQRILWIIGSSLHATESSGVVPKHGVIDQLLPGSLPKVLTQWGWSGVSSVVSMHSHIWGLSGWLRSMILMLKTGIWPWHYYPSLGPGVLTCELGMKNPCLYTPSEARYIIFSTHGKNSLYIWVYFCFSSLQILPRQCRKCSIYQFNI